MCPGLWLVIVEVPGIHPGACFKNPDGPGWVSFRAELLQPLGVAARAPEDPRGRVLPADLDDVEVFPIEDLLPGDGVSAVATPE